MIPKSPIMTQCEGYLDRLEAAVQKSEAVAKRLEHLETMRVAFGDIEKYERAG